MTKTSEKAIAKIPRQKITSQLPAVTDFTNNPADEKTIAETTTNPTPIKLGCLTAAPYVRGLFESYQMPWIKQDDYIFLLPPAIIQNCTTAKNRA